MQFMYFLRRNNEPSTFIPLHCHNYCELIYYYEGSGKVDYTPNPHEPYKEAQRLLWINDAPQTFGSFNFSAKTALLLTPNTVHNESHFVLRSNLVAIGFSLTDEETALVKNQKYVDGDSFIHDCMQAIEREFFQKPYRYIENINAYLTLSLNRILSHSATANENPLSSIDYIINYCDEYFMLPLNIESLASSLGYCPDHFRILFKRKTGMTPKQYVIEKRMHYAEYMIKNTDTPLKEISEKCGYYNYFQFVGLFKKRFGVSPSKYRQE